MYNEETGYFGLPSPEQLATYHIVVCTCGAAGDCFMSHPISAANEDVFLDLYAMSQCPGAPYSLIAQMCVQNTAYIAELIAVQYRVDITIYMSD